MATFDDVPDHVRRTKSRTRGRDTAPEMLVRRGLHRLGYRYRVNHPPLPGLRRTADIVFTKRKVAVFIDGCFWHACPQHYVEPKTRTDFWRTKITGNVERDAETTRRLETAGWVVMRFWEHEPVDLVVATIRERLSDRRRDVS
ncbi:very short patch repair endonuclease [Nocardioides pinisoli]|uniref:Very short patch repair endonuclease n=1 Tax=Nocardioides pinisoli TaxID=2950279 RepID=A0ABT1KRI2_9ACTN|nr:very short patch repair endonuclease [Nocardioides pinisoli]MCP3420352.1 very short patch repair endonuclease [Nocardioides pinisoli]